MTVRTTKAARVNPHPARKARQLAGLTSGIVYAGATIGIGAAAAGGSDGSDTTVQDGDAVAGQQENQVAPDGLGFHLDGGAIAPTANTPTTVVSQPLVLTAPTVPDDSAATTDTEVASSEADNGSTAPTTAVATTSGGSNPAPTTTSSILSTTSTSDAAQPTTTGVTTGPPTTQSTSTQPTTTQATTTQPPTTQPPTTQPPTTESGAS